MVALPQRDRKIPISELRQSTVESTDRCAATVNEPLVSNKCMQSLKVKATEVLKTVLGSWML